MCLPVLLLLLVVSFALLMRIRARMCFPVFPSVSFALTLAAYYSCSGKHILIRLNLNGFFFFLS
jgi:hypothetical protein